MLIIVVYKKYKKMKWSFRKALWYFLVKIKPIRLFVFYNNKRYKNKLNLLNNLNLNENSMVIDIGANNWLVSYYLFDKYSCYIHSFEPNPYCYSILKISLKTIQK